jgi:TolB-like protein/class 3 adenylate cyclase
MAETRKLAAILVSDVVGYSRLAGADEDRILARMRALRSDLIDPLHAVHHGRVVKRTGDGAIVEFRSVVDAVRCAIEVQNGMVERNAGLPPERRIEFRIGIHLGDVVEESDGDLMGDGVNIAARLEGIAKPGAICLSEDAYRQVKGRLDEMTVSDLGATQLKNIAEPIRLYSLEVGAQALAKSSPQTERAASGQPSPGLALPGKPSIAVLPFQNMSGDAEQEYFADGVVEDIITALSRFKNLFVIARNSSFTYKGKSVDVKQVGRELGVRYVLEGSVRKTSSRVRITGQLIDALSGVHLWADRVDGALGDIFDLQDQVTASVVAAVAPEIERAEIERSRRKPTSSLDAYDHYLLGIASVYQETKEANSAALKQFGLATEIDPQFASAYGWAAYCQVQRQANGWAARSPEIVAEAARLARSTATMGRDDAVALSLSGHALVTVVGDLAEGIAYIDRALALNPSLERAWAASGWARIWFGKPQVAFEHFSRAMRLSPLDPFIHSMQNGTAYALFFMDRYDEASTWAETALRGRPDYAGALLICAASHALGGRLSEARDAMARIRQLNVGRLSTLRKMVSFRQPADMAKLEEALRLVGLPE